MKHSITLFVFDFELFPHSLQHNFPYSTHLPLHSLGWCSRPSVLFKFSNYIQFSFIYYFILLPSSERCCCSCSLMLCMINGIRDFDHVENFYVSWISKKRRRIPVLLSRTKFKSKREFYVVGSSKRLQTTAVAGIFGNSQGGDKANGVKIFPKQERVQREGKLNNFECQMNPTIIYLSRSLLRVHLIRFLFTDH